MKASDKKQDPLQKSKGSETVGLKDDGPLSEKDEVKAAEKRLQKNVSETPQQSLIDKKAEK